jgi:hypothetical protein
MDGLRLRKATLLFQPVAVPPGRASLGRLMPPRPGQDLLEVAVVAAARRGRRTSTARRE